MMRDILKKLAPILGIICVCIALGKYFWGNPVNTSWQDTVDTFSSLVHAQSRVPEHLMQKDAVKTDEDFDVNEYFSVLDHLSVEQGYTLDYVYFYGGAGGEPIIYAKQIAQASYNTYSDYEKLFGEPSQITPWDIQYKYMDHIQVDDTPEGFFELIVLRIMGTQFYQYWHAGYNDTTIICDRVALETVLASDLEFTSRIPFITQIRARFLGVEPTVQIRDETVLIRFIVFSKWEGFVEITYTVSRSFPHTIIEVESRTLVPYKVSWAY